MYFCIELNVASCRILVDGLRLQPYSAANVIFSFPNAANYFLNSEAKQKRFVDITASRFKFTLTLT